MFKVTVKNVMDGMEALKTLMSKKLKARTAYKVGRLARDVEDELNEVNKTYREIVTKYGEPSENNPDEYVVPNERINEYNNEINEFMATELELTVDKIPMKELEDENFTPSEIIRLEPFMVIEE